MSKPSKNPGVAGWIAILSAVLAVVGLIVYFYNMSTGYLAGSSMDVALIVFTILAVLLICGLVVMKGKLSDWGVSIIMLIAAVLLSVSIALFIDGRVAVAADQWFLPGMSTDAKGACLNVAIVGVAFYVASVVALIVSAFLGNRLAKQK